MTKKHFVYHKICEPAQSHEKVFAVCQVGYSNPFVQNLKRKSESTLLLKRPWI